MVQQVAKDRRGHITFRWSSRRWPRTGVFEFAPGLWCGAIGNCQRTGRIIGTVNARKFLQAVHEGRIIPVQKNPRRRR